MREEQQKSVPEIWAVGGGKGGAGKSIMSILLAFWLSQMNKRTVLVDADLGGANIHTLMGIKSPPCTLNDFISKKCTSLEDICIDSEIKNLRLISGAGEILSLANLNYVQKMKLIRHILRLDADNVVLDLGAGTSFNTLDFFLEAHKKIVVLTSQPTSIQNAYAFVRNTVYRRLIQLSRRNPSLLALVKTALDPKNELKVQNIEELFLFILESDGKNMMEGLRKQLGRIQPAIITNMVKDAREETAGRIINIVAEKYLTIHSSELGSVVYDKQIEKMVSEMVPLTRLDHSSEAFACTYNIAVKLIGNGSIPR